MYPLHEVARMPAGYIEAVHDRPLQGFRTPMGSYWRGEDAA
jgi:hypothetical protein